ncbi:MAG: sulfotransferase [Bacteroidales bacterium]|nr:sulfotransferase [Bacteroidales bacterium]
MWYRTLNKSWGFTYPLGTKIKLEKDDLVRRARKVTGLTEFGPDIWEEPLERMLVSMNEEAKLSPAGRFISRERLVNLLSIRLRANEYFKRFPEILEQELYPAWIIVGLQRTGTTKLQRLLSADPDHRVLPSWEAINPVPFIQLGMTNEELRIKSPQQDCHCEEPKLRSRVFGRSRSDVTTASGIRHPASNDKRIKIARTSVNAVKYISPGFFAIHPLDPLLPEEDVLLLDISFMSTTTEAMMDVPSYSSWLESVDQTPAYAYYVKLLKLLQWFQPGKRWVLKSPHHLEFPHLIADQIPDVKFIWPHRSIYESIPSFLSMLTYNHMIFSDEVNPRRIAERWIRKTGYALDKAIEFRKRGNHDELFVDVHYKDLVTDSMKEMEKIYRLDGGLTSQLTEQFVRHEKEHPHQKHGVHRYDLTDFNVTKADIDQHTSHYQQFIKTLHGRTS